MSAHRCACGCGDVIYLPIGPADYSLVVGSSGPTLRPSVGNWNICDAHYFITNGEVKWAPKWTQAQIAAGRRAEDERRAAYYDAHSSPAFVRWLLGLGRKLLKVVRR
jgi:hypothetical protein